MVFSNYPGLVKISCDTKRANIVISKLGKDVECSVRLEERNAFRRLGKKWRKELVGLDSIPGTITDQIIIKNS